VEPRLQKWIEEGEEGETENMGEYFTKSVTAGSRIESRKLTFRLTDRLLLINDLINNVHERYQSFTRGDFTASVTIDPSIDPSKGGADAVPTAKITDLISFDDEQEASTNAKGDASSSVLDDFASLTFEAPTTASNGGLANTHSSTSSTLPLDLFDTSSSQSRSSSSMGEVPLGQWGALQLPMNSGNGTPTQKNGTSTPTPMRAQPSQARSSTAAPSSSQAPADPFADLSKW
jgi:ADP-ribosylation factor-binding protein GGA